MAENQPHVLTIEVRGPGYEVICSRGCWLGTSRYQPTEKLAQQRAETHRMAVAGPWRRI